MRWSLAPASPRTRAPVSPAPIRSVEAGGVEVRPFLRVLVPVLVILVLGLAVVRVREDIRATTASIDAAQRRLDAAMAERERLELEAAVLTDPARIRSIADARQWEAPAHGHTVDLGPASAAGATGPLAARETELRHR